MHRPRIRIDMNVNLEHEALIAEAVLASGLRHELVEFWRTDATLAAIESAPAGWSVVASAISDRSRYGATTRIIAQDASKNLLIASWARAEVFCRVITRSQDEAVSLMTSLREALPESADPVDDTVRVTFWNFDGQIRDVTRRIAVPTWNSVRGNYHSRTRSHLEALVDRPPMIAGGKLILWHGPPGTGRTWALRALLKEWRGWAEPHSSSTRRSSSASPPPT